jgi:UDP-N-acetylglucosamine 2-epimerase
MKLLSIVGARPQFVKAAMVCVAIRRHNARSASSSRIRHSLVHTGQHYEYKLSGVFFDQLPLPKPDHFLAVGSGSHGAQTAAMLERIESVLCREKPDAVIVYGDTNSTVAGALAAVKLHFPVAHVEAGLRSFNRRMPEEINRVATDHLSDLLLCPTPVSVKHLEREGITRGVEMVGDVMLDAVESFRRLAARRSDLLSQWGVRPGQYILATIHRAENTDHAQRLGEIVETLMDLGHPVVFPMHPRVRDRLKHSAEYRAMRRLLEKAPGMVITDPVSYLEMLVLEQNARVVLTDSGGVQKEAYFLGVPCLTLREETEWTETLANHWNRVVGTSPSKIVNLVRSLWSRNGAGPTAPRDLKVFGSGKASDRIVRCLLKIHP